MATSVQERIRSIADKSSRSMVMRTLALTIILAVVLLQLSVLYVRRDTVTPAPAEGEESLSQQQSKPPTPQLPSSSPPPPPPPPSLKYLNTDPHLKVPPWDNEDQCNQLPKAHNPRGIFITHKTKEEPLKIFRFHYQWASNMDWEKESKTLCPIPLSLQPLFDHIRARHIRSPSIQWEPGYAPCLFWTFSLPVAGKEPAELSCDTPQYGKLEYTVTGNWTEFEDADIIHFDFAYWDGIQELPYVDMAGMPPRLSHQKWVLQFWGESIGYYSHLSLDYYLSQFDLTVGSPPAIMDVPFPLYELTKEQILEMANREPRVAFDNKTENLVGIMVSNCIAKNHRQELIQTLIDKAGAHSFGSCLKNKDMPAEYETRPGNWGDWMNNKLKMLSEYPFVFAAENSNCLGYVSEKIYHALGAGAIPIYMGAADITDFAPAGSYVDVSAFKSFEEVAEYIKTVDRSQFYKWKEVVKKDYTKFCKYCFKMEVDPTCQIVKRVNFV